MGVEMVDYAEELLPQGREEVAKPTADLFFKRQEWEEKKNASRKTGGPAPDFQFVFRRTLVDFWNLAKEQLGRTDSYRDEFDMYHQVRDQSNAFIEDMRQIEMEDTIFPDVRANLPDLLANVDGAILWTSGHQNYQNEKIERSKIATLLEQSAAKTPEVVRKPIISRNKEAQTGQSLIDFADEHPGETFTVVVYDDSDTSFKGTNNSISQAEGQIGHKINRLFVWAKTGRKAEGMTDEKAAATVRKISEDTGEGHINDVTSFAEFANLVRELRFRTTYPIIVYLDFDGALSDNRLMRLKQSQAFHNHLAKAMVRLGLASDEQDAQQKIAEFSEILSKKQEEAKK